MQDLSRVPETEQSRITTRRTPCLALSLGYPSPSPPCFAHTDPLPIACTHTGDGAREPGRSGPSLRPTPLRISTPPPPNIPPGKCTCFRPPSSCLKAWEMSADARTTTGKYEAQPPTRSPIARQAPHPWGWPMCFLGCAVDLSELTAWRVSQAAPPCRSVYMSSHPCAPHPTGPSRGVRAAWAHGLGRAPSPLGPSPAPHRRSAVRAMSLPGLLLVALSDSQRKGRRPTPSRR